MHRNAKAPRRRSSDRALGVLVRDYSMLRDRPGRRPGYPLICGGPHLQGYGSTHEEVLKMSNSDYQRWIRQMNEHNRRVAREYERQVNAYNSKADDHNRQVARERQRAIDAANRQIR